MNFIDEAIIEVQGGKGGKGCISFRREKYVPRGGPDGGDGGKGGDIVFKVQTGLSTLYDLRHKRHFEGGDGRMGKGKQMEGRGGDDIFILVPPGTMIFDVESGEKLADLIQSGDHVILAKGGRGGKGNAFFKSSTHQAPRFAQPGEDGEVRKVKLELKLLADIGLVGEPNAGKSTLLSVISDARPKIANYPFTTLNPVLGVVKHKDSNSFVVADIPGLIEGAHEGKGLGIQFLKHVERTKMLLHLVSLSPDEMGEPLERFKKINKELFAFDPLFKKRPQIVVLTKIDLLEDPKQLKSIVKGFPKKLKVFAISAPTREGVGELLDYVAATAEKLN